MRLLTWLKDLWVWATTFDRYAGLLDEACPCATRAVRRLRLNAHVSLGPDNPFRVNIGRVSYAPAIVVEVVGRLGDHCDVPDWRDPNHCSCHIRYLGVFPTRLRRFGPSNGWTADSQSLAVWSALPGNKGQAELFVLDEEG